MCRTTRPNASRRGIATVERDAAIKALDFALLLDLLKVEDDPSAWRDIARHRGHREIEKRLKAGDTDGAHKLAFAIVRETGAGGREALRSVSRVGASKGWRVSHSRARSPPTCARWTMPTSIPTTASAGRSARACIGPLAEVLIVEENSRAIRRLRELLFGFGAAGRETVERLKQSPNPAVRRTAIDMLRMFGGQDALADLATMLEDHDPQVQRDAIKAIAQLGNDEAFAVLQKALMSGTAAGNAIPQQLITLKEERAVPLLCYVLNHTVPRGRLVEVHAQIMEAHRRARRASRLDRRRSRRPSTGANGGRRHVQQRCGAPRRWRSDASDRPRPGACSKRPGRRAAAASGTPRGSRRLRRRADSRNAHERHAANQTGRRGDTAPGGGAARHHAVRAGTSAGRTQHQLVCRSARHHAQLVATR